MGKLSAGVVSLFVIAPCAFHATAVDAAKGTVAGTQVIRQEDALVADLLARIALLQEQITEFEGLAAASDDEARTGSLIENYWLPVVRFTDSVLETIFLGKSMFFVACICTVINRIKRNFKFLRSFGTHVIVLQLYYSPWCENENPFCWSILFIFCDTIVFWGVSLFFDVGLRPAYKGDYKFEAHNCYMDLRRPITVDFVTFIAQVGLVLYYIFTMNGYSDVALNMRNGKRASLLKWLVGFAVTAVSGEALVGRTVKIEYWMRIWKRVYEAGGEKVNWIGLLGTMIRGSMDFTINAGAKQMMLNTVPIMLCTEDPLDFVKDVTAVFFIIKLDDMDDPVDILDESLHPDDTFSFERGPTEKARKETLNALRMSLLPKYPAL